MAGYRLDITPEQIDEMVNELFTNCGLEYKKTTGMSTVEYCRANLLHELLTLAIRGIDEEILSLNDITTVVGEYKKFLNKVIKRNREVSRLNRVMSDPNIH